MGFEKTLTPKKINDPLTKSLFNKISIVHDNFPSTALLVLNFAMLTRQYRVLKRDVIKN